jgi:hypothetical protein
LVERQIFPSVASVKSVASVILTAIFLCDSRSAAGLMLTDYRQFRQLTKDKRRNNIIFDKKRQMKPIIENAKRT